MTRSPAASTACLLALAAFAGLGACSPGGAEHRCSGKCDSLGDGVTGVLADRADPIAHYLRDHDIDDEGFIDADFGDILFGVAEVQGCAKESVKTFVVSDDLINGDSEFPRLISAACTDDASKASEFFIAASFADPDNPAEVDLRTIETYAWDATKRRYRFYEAFAADDGGIRVNPEPTVCAQCHLTSADTAPTDMHMTPIMNELTRPWTHWNAEPGFPSFEFNVPSETLTSNSFQQLVDPFKGQANDLETIIRAGHDKVALARLRERRDPVDVDKAMAILRPVFCSEQVNYASEDHDSGVIFNTAALDPGIKQAFLNIRPDNWPWAWVNDDTLRLPAASGETLQQVPVRGNSDVAMENFLMSTRVLSPQQVLQVRALDWQRPVFSDFRCGLWRQARDRFAGGDVPDFGDATRVSHIIPILFDAIMKLGADPIVADADHIIAVPLADVATTGDLTQALAAGSLDNDCSKGFCSLTVDELGAELDTYYTGLADDANREALFAERKRRVCHILAHVDVEPSDERFESPQECAKEVCDQNNLTGDSSCIDEMTTAARTFDTSTPDRKAAAFCAHPIRFPNRPSFPDVGECPAR